MSASVQTASEMKKKSEKRADPHKTANNPGRGTSSENADSNIELSSELNELHWAVITFAGVAARSLTYAEALKQLENHDTQKVSGLCIVTDEAAARVSD